VQLALGTLLFALAILLGGCFGDSDPPLGWEDREFTPDEDYYCTSRVDVDPGRVETPLLAPPVDGRFVAADGELVVPVELGSRLELERSTVELPTPDGLAPMVLARPARIGQDRLVVAYNLVDEGVAPGPEVLVRGQRLVVYDLDSKQIDDSFEPISLQRFGVSPHAAVRGDLVATPNDVEERRVYVATGSSTTDRSTVGRIIGIDLEKWQAGEDPQFGAFQAVNHGDDVCSSTGQAAGEPCGGGLHGEAPIRLLDVPDGSYDVLVATGKGYTNIDRGHFANGLLRLTPELDFDPRCDSSLCDEPGTSPDACLETCENFFVPRTLASDSYREERAQPECEGEFHADCLQKQGYDGASAPISFSENNDLLVWAAADGFVYLLSRDDWSRPHDRALYHDVCSTEDHGCAIPPHTPATSPERVAGAVRMPVYSSREGVPGGLVDFELVSRSEGLQLDLARQAPAPDTDAAVERFRQRPSRLSNGAVVESGTAPRLFRPFYADDENEQGLDVTLRIGDGMFDASYSAPLFFEDAPGDQWMGHAVAARNGSVFDAVTVSPRDLQRAVQFECPEFE
jgi:hypothetical protein